MFVWNFESPCWNALLFSCRITLLGLCTECRWDAALVSCLWKLESTSVKSWHLSSRHLSSSYRKMYTVLCIGVIHPPIISQHAQPPAISVLRSELHAIYSIVMSPYVFGCIRLCSAWNEDRYKYVMTGTFGSYLRRLTTNWARLRWPFGAAGGEETESVVAQLVRSYSKYISGELGWKISEETCNRSTINTCSRCSREESSGA